MATEIIPEDVKQFILQHIDSIAQMEGLLMICADPQKEWNAHTLARALFLEERQAEALLMRMSEQGFIAPGISLLPWHYRYHPKTPELGAMIERVTTCYRKYLIPVTNLIHAKPKSRIQEFADAFKLRKE